LKFKKRKIYRHFLKNGGTQIFLISWLIVRRKGEAADNRTTREN